MKESNILADNVEKNLPVRDNFHSTKEQFMKESNILADNVGKNLPLREIFLDT